MVINTMEKKKAEEGGRGAGAALHSGWPGRPPELEWKSGGSGQEGDTGNLTF